MKKPEFKVHDIGDLQYWHLTTDDFGWATLFICDKTGVVSICSDWGNASYRWNPKHVGDRTVTSFFSTAGPDYLVNKLSYEQPKLKERVLDEEPTIEAFAKILGDKEDAEMLVHEIDGPHWETALAIEAPENCYELAEAVVTCPTYHVEFWTKCLIPALQEIVRK